MQISTSSSIFKRLLHIRVKFSYSQFIQVVTPCGSPVVVHYLGRRYRGRIPHDLHVERRWENGQKEQFTGNNQRKEICFLAYVCRDANYKIRAMS